MKNNSLRILLHFRKVGCWSSLVRNYNEFPEPEHILILVKTLKIINILPHIVTVLNCSLLEYLFLFWLRKNVQVGLGLTKNNWLECQQKQAANNSCWLEPKLWRVVQNMKFWPLQRSFPRSLLKIEKNYFRTKFITSNSLILRLLVS